MNRILFIFLTFLSIAILPLQARDGTASLSRPVQAAPVIKNAIPETKKPVVAVDKAMEINPAQKLAANAGSTSKGNPLPVFYRTASIPAMITVSSLTPSGVVTPKTPAISATAPSLSKKVLAETAKAVSKVANTQIAKATVTKVETAAKTVASATQSAIAITKRDVSAITTKTAATTKAAASSLGQVAEEGRTAVGGRLARLTAYWSGEGDYYTGRGMSSTGIRLHNGHCAVDPNIIPYGSVVEIAGVGKYIAVDTGSAVISREAAKCSGHNSAQRSALVIDLYFESRREGERFASSGPKFASISWWKPSSADFGDRGDNHLLAEGDAAKDRKTDL